MIIEAGYDIHQVLSGVLHHDETAHGALWLMAMDADLRLCFVDAVVETMVGELADHVDEIAKALRNDEGVVYYALAYETAFVQPETDDHLAGIDHELNKFDALKDFELLGQMICDPEGCLSSIPRYSFRDYAGLEHLPRALVVPGPHDYAFACECPACTHYRKRTTEIQQRHSDRARS